MKRSLLCCLLCITISCISGAQDIAVKANAFIQLLDASQRTKALYPFDTTERYRFNYIPLDDRGGISMNELKEPQQKAVFELMRTCLADETVKRVNGIMQLDAILKELEQRKPDDHYRDPGKYFITIFGIPAANTIWGWRFEGHHISFNFSASKNQLVAGTPAFMGANPAIVLEGPHKGEAVLKMETEQGFALLHALSPAELKKAITDPAAPAEILTAAKRKAIIEQPTGIRYNELSPANQQLLLQLIKVYIQRYTISFGNLMLKEIQAAGLDQLWFSWAGNTAAELGKPYYYRVQGPTIIIEYDNTQNNANHIHTVVRDLKNDFGGDLLLEHYRKSH